MYEPEEEPEARRPFESNPKRLRRESMSESAIGTHIGRAAEEADARVLRARSGPPPTEAEAELLGAAVRRPAQLFSRVLVTDLEFGEQERYTIVPHDEGDLAAGKITIGSPLGRALLQEYPGAIVAVKTPGGERLYRLLQVEP